MTLAPSDIGLAFSHPLRARLLLTIAATNQPVSPSTLAKTLGEPLGNVSYHIKLLHGHGAIVDAGTRQVRGAVEHFYVVADDDRLRAVIAAMRSSSGPDGSDRG